MLEAWRALRKLLQYNKWGMTVMGPMVGARWSGWEEVSWGGGGGRASRESACAGYAQGLGDILEMGMNEILSQYRGKDSGLILAV